MFDRMVIKTKVPMAQIPTLVQRFYLQECTREGALYYQSSAYGNFEAMFVTIDEGCGLTIRLSLHKHFWKDTSGLLDNSGMFTMDQARKALDDIVRQFELTPSKCRVTYYEIGLNLPMSKPPIDFIRNTLSVIGRETFIDANYERDRQRTTERSRNIRKVMKVYDKTFEAESKGRKVDKDILRIETIYRHQSVLLSEFFDNMFIRKTQRRFYTDWCGLSFIRPIQAAKGMKASQMEKARDILRLGVDRYLEQGLAEYKARTITKKCWETMRVFAHEWESRHCHNYTIVDSPESAEYARKLLEQWCVASGEKQAPYGARVENSESTHY